MVLQHSSVGESPYFGISTLNFILFNAKVGTFPPSYAVIPSFISCFTTFYCIDPYFFFKLTILKILRSYLHIMPDNSENSIAFASHTLTKANATTHN